MKIKSILISLFLVNIVYAQMSVEEKRKILEEKLFKKTPQKAKVKEIYIPLYVNNILQNEVLVKFGLKENIYIKKETGEYLASLLKKKFKEKFKLKVDKKNFLTLKSIEQMGIKASYNQEKISLEITLPMELKKASTLRLNEKQKRGEDSSLVPSSYAGGANIYLNQQLNRRDGNAVEKTPLQASSNLYLNMHNYVFESSLNYNKETQLSRGGVRVLKDDTNHKLRYQAGDITLPSDNRMENIEVLGVALEKLFYIGDPSYFQNITRINSHEFFIKNKSQVEIYINERYARTLNLLGGTHNLYDLNLPTGVNRIKLIVIEEGGKREEIEFNDFSYFEILKKGLVKYGGGVGIKSRHEESNWIYEKDKKVASAYVEYGLFDSVTVKGGIQATDNYLVGNTEFFIGTNIGFFNPYIIMSKKNSKVGSKKGIEYQTNIDSLMINLGYEDTDNDYSLLTGGENQGSTLYRGAVYSNIGMGITLGLSASDYKNQEDREKKYGLTLQKYFKNFSTELNFNQSKKNGNKKEKEIFLSFNYRFGNDYDAQYTNYVYAKSQQLALNQTSSDRYGLTSNLIFEKNKESNNYSMQLNLNDEKFIINSNYEMKDYRNSNSKNENLGIQLSSGFAFTEDKITLTSPLNSSFIIVDNEEKLETPLGIEGYHSSDDFIYDTYTIDVSNYTHRELFIDESNLDFGADLKRSQESVTSNYRSGSLMKIKINNFYSAKGIFYDKKTKKPLAFKAFKAFNTQTGEQSSSFTNENGAFTINHIGAGKYNIRFIKEKGYEGVARYSFEIEEKSNKNLFDMGNIYIKIPKKTKSKKIEIYKNSKK